MTRTWGRSTNTRRWAWLGIIVLLGFGAAPASAHTRSESQSSWRVTGKQLIGVFQVDAHRVTQLARAAGDLDDLSTVLVRHLAEASACGRRAGVRDLGAPAGSRPSRVCCASNSVSRVRRTWACPRRKSRSMRSDRCRRAMSTTAASRNRIDRCTKPCSRAPRRRCGSAARHAPAPDQFVAFVVIGLEHVLSGLDHLAFLLALMLLAGRPTSAALAATGFTIGHSVTLGLVAFGWLRPQTAAIEALIGFTIAFTAARVPGDPERWDARSRVVWLLAVSVAIAALPAIAPLSRLLDATLARLCGRRACSASASASRSRKRTHLPRWPCCWRSPSGSSTERASPADCSNSTCRATVCSAL